jgi:oligopeptide transport system substrate-binding protein
MLSRWQAAGLCALLVATLGAHAAERVLHRAGTDDPTTIDPHKTAYPSETTIVSDLFVGLTTLDARGVAVPGCAESWQVSPGGRTWTFRLRDGLQWSDGTPMKSEEIEWSLQRALDPKTAYPYAGRLFAIRNARAVATGRAAPATLGVRAVDARTVIVELEHPTPYLAEVLASFGLPAPRARIEKYGNAWIRPENLATNGPFTVERWIPNGYVRLRKNPRFFDAANVRLDAVVHYPAPQPVTALRRFAAGELDFVLAVPPDQLAWARKNAGAALRMSPGLGVEVVAFNMRSGVTKDARVRQALSLAIDRDAIARNVLGDARLAAWNYVPPVTVGYSNPPLPPMRAQSLAERQAQARSLLQQAGYGPSKPLPIRLGFPANDFNRRIAVVIDAMWRQIGVKASLEAKEQRALAASIASGDFDAARQLWLGGYSDAQAFLERLDGTAAGSTINPSGYVNSTFDTALRRAEAAVEPQARLESLRSAEQIALRDQPVAPIYFFVGRRLVSPQLTGWTDNPRGIHLSRYMSVPAR